ncbi:DUF1540 domain-containing protein [Clostridium sp. YIM B02515]|uniref:DUF1540 domain-containing protein n=1 Tax=Clostridium rhizosphaerae TaxID=2803861 RepID=A0ABS1TA86_9CLOT|nr:DUF1540 domain-containing protein [Clostridium rhizosphaerae]MBL4936264.1 DUF1540 domain-containing protein [Clostridium rhizosphaerae]
MSRQLSCSALDCVHNMSGLCSANTIHVLGSGAHTSNQTMCNTFAEKGFKNSVAHFPNMNVTGEIRQLLNNDSIEMSPSIKCESVNCIYNEDRVCMAHNVQVSGPRAQSSQDTVCETFRMQ